MEANISMLLGQIKICDSLDEMNLTSLGDNDGYESESLIHLASYYHQMLNCVLSNLTMHIDEKKNLVKSASNEQHFSNLQLTIQNENETHYLNEAGQFVIGVSNKLNLDDAIDFINKNKAKSLQLFNDHIK